MMTTRLKNMSIKEGSFVPEGANPDADIVLFKNKEKKPLFKGVIDKIKNFFKASTMNEVLDSQEARQQWWDLTNAFERSVRSIIDDEEVENAEDMLMQSCQEFTSAARPLINRMTEEDKVYLSADGAVIMTDSISEDIEKGKYDTVADRVCELIKSFKSKINKGSDTTMTLEEILKGLPEEQVKVIKEAIKGKETELNKAKGEVEKNKGVLELVENLKKALNPKKEESVTKGIEDENIAKALETLVKENQELKKDNEKITKSLNEMVEKVAIQEFVKKAGEFKNLAVEPDEFGKVLKNAAGKLDKDDYNGLIKILSSANEVIGKGEVFKELGGEGNNEDTAMGKLEKKAEEIEKANAGMTREQALAKALEENPELYNEYEEERSGN